MSETGDRLRKLFEEIAPPLDVRAVMEGEPLTRRRSRGWAAAVAAAAFVLLAGGGWLLFLRGRSEPIAASEPPTTTSADSPTSTFATGEEVVELRPVRVACTSELNAFPCSALTDDDPDNAWNAEAGGVGTSITFYFSPPVQITEVMFYNLEDTERFTRNARIKGIEVEIDDLPQSTIAELEDSNEPQRVQVRSLRTSRLTITITSAYPGRVYDGREPFRELALETIKFFGRAAPDYPGETCLPSDPRTLPDVVGASEDEALSALTQAGFCPEQVWLERRHSNEVPEGWVIATDPPAGSVLVEDEVVRVLVSGPDPTTATTSAATEPLPGEWFESSLPCCGSRGYLLDLLWDGEQFLALARHPGDASVWRSEDGLTWEEVAYLGDFTTGEGPGSLDHGEAGYLAGGSVGDQATVWYSSDGTAWTQVTLGSGRVRDVAVTTAGLMAVGTSHRPTAVDWQTGEFTGVGMVWTSSDGPVWQAEDLGSLPAYSDFSDVYLLGGRMVAVGSSFPTPSPLDRQWLTAVSDRWGSWEVLAPASLSAFQFDATAVVHRYLAAADGPEQVLWTTADGESWLSSPLGGLAVHAGGTFAPQGVTGMGEVLVMAGLENYVPSGEVYNRSDPAVWLREPDGTWRGAEGAPGLDPPGGGIYLAAASLDRVVLVLDYVDDRLLIWVFRPEY